MNRKIIPVVLTLVMFLTTSAFASMSHEGNLEFTWDKDSKLNHSHWVKLTYDVSKDFGQGIAAGLSLSMSPSDTGGVFATNWDGWANMDFGHTFVSLSTWKEFTGATYALATGKKLPGGPGAVVDFNQFEDLTLQGHLGNHWADQMIYTFGAKAAYDFDGTTINVGFHGRDPENLKYAAFAGASTSLDQGINVTAEAGYRNDLEDWRFDGANWYQEELKSGFAVATELEYENSDLDAKLFAMYKSPFYIVNDWDDDVANTARGLYLMSEWTGVLLALDLDYNVTRYLTAGAQLDFLPGVTDSRDDSNTSKVQEIKPFGVSVDASYRASLGTTITGRYSWYDNYSVVGAGLNHWEWSLDASYDLNSKYAEASAAYTFADGFVGTIFANKAVGEDLGFGLKLNIDF